MTENPEKGGSSSLVNHCLHGCTLGDPEQKAWSLGTNNIIPHPTPDRQNRHPKKAIMLDTFQGFAHRLIFRKCLTRVKLNKIRQSSLKES